MLEWLRRTQENRTQENRLLTPSLVYYQRIGLSNSKMEGMRRVRRMERGVAYPALSRAATLQNLHVFTIPEALLLLWGGFSFFLFKSFIYLWLCWVFVAVCFSLVAVSRGCSLLRRVSTSLWWLLFLPSAGSRVHGLQQLWRVGSGTQARQLWPRALAAP